MTRILALDTTSAWGSLALLEDDAVLEEVLLQAPDGFAQVLFGHIEQLLARHGCALRDVDVFAAAAGPGSFTGVRVGLTAVKGLAEALDRQAVGVSNLQALAAYGATRLRAPVLDARRGEVYGALYSADLEAVGPETVGPFGAWLDSLPTESFEFISPDLAPFEPVLAASRFVASPRRSGQRAVAAAVGWLALRRVRAGEPGNPTAIDANYVRRSDAELRWNDDRSIPSP